MPLRSSALRVARSALRLLAIIETLEHCDKSSWILERFCSITFFRSRDLSRNFYVTSDNVRLPLLTKIGINPRLLCSLRLLSM